MGRGAVRYSIRCGELRNEGEGSGKKRGLLR
jgi:hypothetical protein